MSSGRDTGSPSGALSQHDLGRVLLHALQLTAGTALTYLGEWASGQNWGVWQPVVTLAVTVGIDAARRFTLDTRRAG